MFCHQGFQSLMCMKACMHWSCAFDYHWAYRLYLGAQGPAGGGRIMTWIRNRERGSGCGRKNVSGSHRSLSDIETSKEWTPVWPLEQLTSRLWLSDRLCVEDGRAVAAPHRANWLVVTRSGSPNPQGLTEELGATPSSKLHSLCGQSEGKEEWLYFGRFCVFRHYPVQFQNGGVQRKPHL